MPYSPNDSHITPAALAYLHSPEGRPLLDHVLVPNPNLNPNPPHSLVSQIAALRKKYPPEAVHAALTLIQLQPKARQKFPNLAQAAPFIWCLPEALEQATDSAVAQHKAARFAQALPAGGHIYDLCSGLGGDAFALAHIAPTTAIDLSAPRLACLRYNSESLPPKHPLQTQQADITAPSFLSSLFPLPSSSLFHIDPARRTNGKRSPQYEDLIPPPAFLETLLRHFPGGAIKLSPAVDFHTLPPGHLEIISHNQSVVQAILWLGTLASQFSNLKSQIQSPLRTATLFKNHHLTFTYTAVPATPIVPPFPLHSSTPNFLYESDPALTRSQLAAPLAASLHLTPLTPDAGYLLSPNPNPNLNLYPNSSDPPPLQHPALTPFHLLQLLPYSESKLIKALQNPTLPPSVPGPTEVKTRGKIPGLDTDRLQLLLSKATAHKRTVFIFRHGRDTLAAITHRMAP